ncbi:hypothetical protein J3R82DRAFT_1948 [Butyriboletus roseoflavus]|nr:hypothetical protein J3R82DRAFT_1948 [Butyriboletus roseoflavus]
MDPPPSPGIGLGALLIGGLVAVALWGVTSAQTYIYYQRYPKDPLPLKLIVALLWLLDTFDACMTSHILFSYLVKNYLNPLDIATLVWSVFIHVGVTCIMDAIVRSMFAQQIWKFSGKNIVLTSIVGTITLCILVISLVITIEMFRLQSLTQLHKFSTLLYINFGIGASADLFVAIVLCYYLFMSGIGFRSTDTLLNTLNAYIVTTGLLTSVDVILGTALYALMPKNFMFIGFYCSVAKLYISSYLALLNAREPLQDEGGVALRPCRVANQPYTTDFGPESFVSSRTDHLKIVLARLFVTRVEQAPHRELEVRIQRTVDHERYV